MVEQVSFSKLPGFSRLFQDYTELEPQLLSLYAGNFNSDDVLERRCRDLSSQLSAKPELAEALLRQNQKWGADSKVLDHIELLGSGSAIAVITGQQIGLFVNPIYIIYKAITAIQLADYVSKELGHPCVPVFWMATGDHDFQEIKTATFPTSEGLKSVEMSKPANYSGPVGRIPFAENLDQVIIELRSVLPNREGLERSLQLLAKSYGGEKSLEDAFGSFITELFSNTGLILVSPDDGDLKRLAIPIFEKEIVDAGGGLAALKKGTESIGHLHQAQIEPSKHNLFYLGKDSRTKIVTEKDKWRVGHDRLSTNELLEHLYRHPENFSPNVVLRPLMQDQLFPTLCYIAGPGETAYFGQLKPVYEWAGVSMPIIYPRASVTLLESRLEKSLEKLGLNIFDLQNHTAEEYFSSLAYNTIDLDLEALFEGIKVDLDRAFQTLEGELVTVDKTMKKSARARQVAVMKEINSLKKKVVRVQKKKMIIEKTRIGDVFHSLQPAGGLQERKISALYYIARFGTDLVSILQSKIILDTTKHQIIKM